MPKKKKIGFTYVGESDYVPGVPARDLSAEEWEALPERLREKAIKAGTHIAEAGEDKPIEEEVINDV